MLDLLLAPAAVLAFLAYRSARAGGHRLHGHLMAAAFTLLGLRLALQPGPLPGPSLGLGLGILAMAGVTALLGGRALAWREGRSRDQAAPRVHRASGVLTLSLAALAVIAWLLRHRG